MGAAVLREMLRTDVLFTLAPGARAPFKARGDDAGWDLYTMARVLVKPRGTAEIPTGLRVALPQGVWLHLLSRSSTLKRYGLRVETAVIDNGYRGELFVQVHNPTARRVVVEKHSRIAQIVPHRTVSFDWVCVRALPPSSRGTKGFGSSGV